MKEYHILNGECLKALLENEYSNLLVMNEALIQGPIKEKDEDSFFEKRALFISEEYKACTKEKYLEGMSEFNKIKAIEKNTIINFWFGKDVFCQVNFWFLLDFLKSKIDTNDFYLIFPQEGKDCSFGNKEKRESSFNEKIYISKEDFIIFCKLWDLFQKKEFKNMKNIIKDINSKYLFITDTVEAIINMEDIEKEIFKLEDKEKSFGKLFQKVCEDYSIYGYGDLQIMYILEKNKKA